MFLFWFLYICHHRLVKYLIQKFSSLQSYHYYFQYSQDWSYILVNELQYGMVLGIVASFSFNFHFMSNTFRIILAVPSKQGFCNISTVISKPSCIHFSNCFVTVPNAPITTGITSTSFILHTLTISYFKSQ